MRILVLAAAIAALAGCATQPPPAPPRPISEASDYQVCEALILGNPVPNGAQIVAGEIRRRGLDCAPYANAIVAQDAARRQEAMQALQIMQANRPVIQPMPMPPRPVNCTSTRIGNQVQTNCF